MAKLVTLLEQHWDKQQPTVAIQGTTWWEGVLAHVKLQECGLEVNLPVNVCCYQPACVHVRKHAFGLSVNLMEDSTPCD